MTCSVQVIKLVHMKRLHKTCAYEMFQANTLILLVCIIFIIARSSSVSGLFIHIP